MPSLLTVPKGHVAKEANLEWAIISGLSIGGRHLNNQLITLYVGLIGKRMDPIKEAECRDRMECLQDAISQQTLSVKLVDWIRDELIARQLLR